jgi:hypothetical protein
MAPSFSIFTVSVDPSFETMAHRSHFPGQSLGVSPGDVIATSCVMGRLVWLRTAVGLVPLVLELVELDRDFLGRPRLPLPDV